jgi:hypothetical protein
MFSAVGLAGTISEGGRNTTNHESFHEFLRPAALPSDVRKASGFPAGRLSLFSREGEA